VSFLKIFLAITSMELVDSVLGFELYFAGHLDAHVGGLDNKSDDSREV